MQTFYHNACTIRWIESHVGWDMPIEKLNMWIKESVVSNITESQIIKFIWRLNFVQHVARVIKGLVQARCQQAKAVPKDVSADVQAIKVFLRANIGANYIAATRPSDSNQLNVDMSEWGGLRTPRGSYAALRPLPKSATRNSVTAIM